MVSKYNPSPLGEIAYITKLAGYEYTKHFDYQVGGEIIALRSLNIKNGSIDISEIHTIPKSVSDALPRSKLICEDIVLGYVGSRLGNLAKIEEDNKFHLAPNVAVIRPNEGINSDYLLQYMQSEYFQSRLWAFASSTGQPALSMTNIRKLPVLIFALPEQQKIAKILSTWDNAISTTERLIENSTQQKKALMQQLLTGKKRLLDESGERFAGEWKFSNFDNLFKVANNKKTQVKSSDYLEEGSVPIVDQGKQLVSGYTNNSEVYLDVPVIVFGDHTRIVKWIDFEFAQGADGTQVLKNMKDLHSKFAYYLLLNTDVPNLGYSRHMRELKEKDFKYPLDKTEQQKIATVLTNADKGIELLEQQLADLQREKKALMQVLLTGKKRVVVDGEV